MTVTTRPPVHARAGGGPRSGPSRSNAGRRPRQPALRSQPPQRPRPPRRTIGRRAHEPSTDRRVRSIAIPLGLFAALVIGMLVKIQIVGPERYVERGERQRMTSVPLLGLRGSILDRNGEALALSVLSKAISANPRMVADPRAAAKAVAPILGLSIDQLETDLSRPDTGFVYLARGVDPDLAARVAQVIDADKLQGISITDEEQRVDPGDDLAQSLIGQVKKGSVNEPLFGLEKLLDPQLRGSTGEKLVEIGHTGDRSTIVGTERVVTEPKSGSNVTLTLDRPLQYWAEKVLGDQLTAIGAKSGSVIVGRPQTGEILAMASMVNQDGTAVSSQLNLATRAYEPGSVMKLITASGAFEDGIVQPDTKFSVADSIRLYDKKISDSHHHPVELMSVDDIIAQSSNVGTIKIAQLLTQDRILHYLDAFGFGQMTDLGLPKEQAGEFRRTWSGTDIGSIPIGQSILVTPVQMWSAYNAIANDGVYVAPRLVTDIVDAQGHHQTPDVPAPRRVVSSSTAQKVNGALRQVIEEGTGKALQIPGYTIAAKTGTAYKPFDGGGYTRNGEHQYDASFVGFFPATNPQLSIMVMVDQPPKGLHLGSVAAGPVFDQLARLAMKRFGIPGDVVVEGEGSGKARAQAARPAAPEVTVPTVTDPVVPPVLGPADGVAPDPAAAAALVQGVTPPSTEPDDPLTTAPHA